jgi:WD40 repeat protein
LPESPLFNSHGVRSEWSPDGTQVVINSCDPVARVWNAATGEVAATLNGHTSPIIALAWNPQGTRITTCSKDDVARVWDSTTGRPVAMLSGRVSSVAWSPSGSRIVSVCGKDRILVWDPETGTESLVLDGQISPRFSPDGSRIYTWRYFDPIAYDSGRDKPYLASGFYVAPTPRDVK